MTKKNIKKSTTNECLCLSNFQLKKIKPLTKSQEQIFSSDEQDRNLVLIGSPGTGKTFCGLYLALKRVLAAQTHEKLIIVRSAVATRDQGFMPGTCEEKMEVYERPYQDIVDELIYRNPYVNSPYEQLKRLGVIEFTSTSFLRGLSFNNCFVLVDEIQNMNFWELSTVMTRIRKGSNVFCCGDIRQNDLLRDRNDSTGFGRALDAYKHMSCVDIVEFGIADIVAGDFVRDWIIASMQ